VTSYCAKYVTKERAWWNVKLTAPDLWHQKACRSAEVPRGSSCEIPMAARPQSARAVAFLLHPSVLPGATTGVAAAESPTVAGLDTPQAEPLCWSRSLPRRCRSQKASFSTNFFRNTSQ
jgi:hypothetical protein